MKKQNTIGKIRGALKHFTLGLAVSAALAVMSVGPMAQAIEIWGGPTISFTKADNADWTLEANQDRITPNVWLTRGNSMQLFNIKIETEAGGYGSDSPKDVEWAWQGINGNSDNPADIKAANYASLIFGRFDLIYNIPEVVSRAAVVHLITDDIYIEIQFTSWTQGAGGGTPAGGGFSYTRSTYSPP
jgi:hypothetical protein